jgi:two-component system, OmpR family, sensor histidine kinase MtrB
MELRTVLARLAAPSLRGIATTAVVAISLMAVAVCATLVVLTTHLHRTSLTVRNAMVSVKLAESAQIDLLMHERISDEVVRAEIADRIRRRAREARQHVNSPEEHQAVEHAVGQVERFINATRGDVRGRDADGELLEATYTALESVASINLEQAEAAVRESTRWDDLGNLIGIATGALILIVLGTLLWWLRRSVVQPVFSLAAAMERFVQGDLQGRTTEQGAAELRAMARRFNAMADALARQHEARLTYLAGVAHDLRNPLAALQMSAAALADHEAAPTEERLQQLFAIVGRQVGRLERMVGDLLDAARIEVGHLTLEFDRRDLNAVVREAAELFENVSPSHSLRLQLREQPIYVRCDNTRIEQVLVNLLSNAIKYSPGGGEVKVSAQIEGGNAVVRVSDRGMGIAQGDLERLWEPFHRASDPTKGALPGAGLGLSIVRRIVKAHGGEISVHSRVGAGSTFAVHLPLAESQPEGAGAKAGGRRLRPSMLR